MAGRIFLAYYLTTIVILPDDIRRTAISMWFANGMSEHDVMVLAGHASFATTHEFYLAVADDLVHRTRAATAHGLHQKMVHFDARAF